MDKSMANGGSKSSGLAPIPNDEKQQKLKRNIVNSSQDKIVSKRRVRIRCGNFSFKESFDLLKIWGSQEMQWQIKYNSRKFKVWEAMSSQMGQKGYEKRTGKQCKNRIRNLTSIYYRIKNSTQKKTDFYLPYYKLIGEILDRKKNIRGEIASTANAASNSSAFVDNGVSPSRSHSQSSSNPSGFSSHMALVEEGQHQINGNPDMRLGHSKAGTRSRNDHSHIKNGTSKSPPLQNSKPNNASLKIQHQQEEVIEIDVEDSSLLGSDNLSNILYPQVSLSEGNSPIRLDHSRIKNGTSKSPPLQNSKSNNASLKIQHQQEDLSQIEIDYSLLLGSDMEQDSYQMSDIEEQNYLLTNDEPIYASVTPNPFILAYEGISNDEFMMGMENSNPAKRARDASTNSTTTNSATNSTTSNSTSNSTNSFGKNLDPLRQHLSEMIEIERQYLDLERERAENERQTMVYFMQTLQQSFLSHAGQETKVKNPRK